MAAASGEYRQKFFRPFHEAYQANKVACPESQCLERHLFFEKDGLAQHYRIAHKCEVDATNVSLTMKQLHGEETLAYIRFLSELNSKVGDFVLYHF